MNSDGSETGLENRGQAKSVGIDTSVPRQYAESTSKALDSPAKRCVAIRLFGSCPRLRAICACNSMEEYMTFNHTTTDRNRSGAP